MVNFTKIFGLAGAAIVFSGLAYGQAVCAAPTAIGLGIIRAEGTTEQVAQLQFVCTTVAANVAGSASLQIFLSPALPVTSKVLSTSTGATEIVATVNGGAQVNATVSGSTINFSAIPLGALGAGGTYTFLISNVRVNATSLTVGTGVPPTVAELGFISGSTGTISPAALASTQVAFAQNGLGTAKTFTTFKTNGVAPTAFPGGTASGSGANNFVICNPYSPSADAKGGVLLASVPLAPATTTAGSSLAFVVQINENFASAFRTAVGEASQVVTAPVNTVVDGTRLQVNFSNVPSNVTLYVPVGAIPSQAAGGTGVIQLTASAPGTAFAPVTASTSSSITGNSSGLGGAAGLAAVTLSSGAGSAVFEVTTQDLTNLDVYNVPVFAVSTANSIAGSSTPITASVSFNPIGSTVIPNFAVTSSTTTLTGSTFNLCTTSLLFPFVTNQLGFDTGLAIANTSTDPFGTSGATAQAGTCTLNFYGSGAPSPANVVTASVPSGTVYAGALSGVAAGFQGYIIAQCAFQFAHGFAFITDGVGANGGLSQGYLAGVIPDTNQIARGANPIGNITKAGVGETLGN
jgi:hypothetical protein